VTSSEPEERRVELGPLFASGVVLVIYGLLRRRVFTIAAGLGAIFLDQRSEFGRSVKERARAKFMTVQYVEGQRDETRVPK
jgi:hypothetical protein